jgi:hypothetical protein
MNKFPNKLVITDGAFAFDGGSTYITGIDDFGNEFEVYLDWSIESKLNNSCKLYFNNNEIEKKSIEEKQLLILLENALYNSKNEVIEENKEKFELSKKRIILGDDINNVINSIENGQNSALKSFVDELLKKVNSNTYFLGK